MNVELTHAATVLLGKMADGYTLMQAVGAWSSWYLVNPDGKPPWRRMIKPTVQALIDANLIAKIDEAGTDEFGAHYRCFNYTVTGAGRALLKAIHAPTELT